MVKRKRFKVQRTQPMIKREVQKLVKVMELVRAKKFFLNQRLILM
jgi:hypothetical protein